MNPGKKYRGRMKNVVLDYVKDMEEDLKKAKKDRVFITHSGCDKEIVDEVKNYLKQLDVFDEIYHSISRLLKSVSDSVSSSRLRCLK